MLQFPRFSRWEIKEHICHRDPVNASFLYMRMVIMIMLSLVLCNYLLYELYTLIILHSTFFHILVYRLCNIK